MAEKMGPLPTIRVAWLDELDLGHMVQGWETPKARRAVTGGALRVAGKEYARGVGTHSISHVFVKLNRGTRRFHAEVGVDDRVGLGRVMFRVIADGVVVYDSGLVQGREPARHIDLDVSNVDALELFVDAPNGDTHHGHANWCDAYFELVGERPYTMPRPVEPAVRLTPLPRPEPRFNGPKIFGVRPGSPLLVTVPVSGARPMRIRAAKLPPGIALDSRTGRLSGRISRLGEHLIRLTAENDAGRATRDLKLVVGNEIALTPPLGWNSWNAHGLSVSGKDVRAAAQAIVDRGLIHYGFSYVNIDDGWQGARGGPTKALLPNEKFADMGGLVAFIHELGLRAGIYSTPWTDSCGGLPGGSAFDPDGREWRSDGKKQVGPYRFVANDVAQYAAWGFDYLKYDWSPDVANTSEMRAALDGCGRDIVLSLSANTRIELAPELSRLANCWRTTSDLIDTWWSLRAKFAQQHRWVDFSRPGHWNDPDMLIVGCVGRGWSGPLIPTRLSPNEQHLHIGMWAMLCAPLLLGCDMTALDDFTLSLMTNGELLDIHQDSLGRQARRTWADESRETELWARPLEDGATAAALVNLSSRPREVAAEWEQLGLAGPQAVRDVWRQAERGVFENRYAAEVAPHSALILKFAARASKP